MPALIDAIRPRSSDDLYDLFEQAHPHHPVSATSRRIIEDMWDDYAAAGNEHRLVAATPGGELVALSYPHTAVGGSLLTPGPAAAHTAGSL